MRFLAALALAALCITPARADDAADMGAAASTFYTVTIGQFRGLPDASVMTRLTPVITPALAQALTAAIAAQDRWSTKNRNAPPLLEGDIFSSLYEGATGFSVASCRADGDRGQCEISLIHNDQSGRPTRWTDRLLLDRTAQGWRVNDIAYGGSWPFANSNGLQALLKTAIGMSAP